MRIFLFLVVMLFCIEAMCQPLLRSLWTTNAPGSVLPDGDLRRLTEYDSKTYQVDGGGSSGSFITTNMGGSNSGYFNNRFRLSGGNLLADEWWEAPGGGAYDFNMGLDVADPGAEVLVPIWSYSNSIPDSVFRFWKHVGLQSGATLSSNAGPGKVIQSDASGVMAWATPEYASLSGAYAIEDFSLYAATTTPTINSGVGWIESGIVTATSKIVPRVWVDGVTRNVLQFNGRGQYARKMPWGTNWQELRIGVLISFTNRAANFTNSYAFGIGAGTNSGYYQAGNSNFVGFGNDGSDNTFQYSNALFAPYYNAVFFRGVHKTNTVTANNISVTSSSGTGVGIFPRFTELILNVTRADFVTNETITIGYINPSGLGPAQTSSYTVLDGAPTMPIMLYDVNYETTSGIRNNETGSGTFTLNTNMRTQGQLDTVSLSWGYSSDMMEFGGIIIRKIR